MAFGNMTLSILLSRRSPRRALRIVAVVIIATSIANHVGTAGADQQEPRLPSLMLSVYRWASSPAIGGCTLPAGLLAAVGDVTSEHARSATATLEHDGTMRPGIFSEPFDGIDGRQLTPDSDGGLWDLDPVHDRASGPFQFIPSTWAQYGMDGNGDGFSDPQNVWDSSAAASKYLCANGAGDFGSLDAAIASYFGSDDLTTRVRSNMARFGSITGRATTGEIDRFATIGVLDGIATLYPNSDGTEEKIASSKAGLDSDNWLVGDWNGDGQTTPAVFRSDEQANNSFVFLQGDAVSTRQPVLVGNVAATPLVGDWNADGIDDVGTFSVGHFDGVFLLRSGGDVLVTRFGLAGDIAISGDWDGDGYDGPGVYRPSTQTFHLADQRGRPFGPPISAQRSSDEATLDYSSLDSAIPIVGDWNGDGFSGLGLIYRMPEKTIVEMFDVHGRFVGEKQLPTSAAVLTGRWEPRQFSPTAAVDEGSNQEVPLWRVGGILVHADIADRVAAMIDHAAVDGILLTGWGWRSHQRQIELRTTNCADVWETPAGWCSPPTAVPGRSRHETGRAIDFHIDGAALSRSSPQFIWLAGHAGEYGLFNLPTEPWHWSVDGK